MPEKAMASNKVVARFKDGTTIKGVTNDFSPNRTHFHLELRKGETIDIDMEELKAVHFIKNLRKDFKDDKKRVVEINMEDLKAAFFVKDFNGDKNRKDNYNDVVAGGGRKIQVKFFDGEVITGYAMGYSPDRHGFFIIPADLQSNNERIFVIKSATEKVEFP